MVLEGGNRGQAHLDDGLHCCWVAVEHLTAVVDEELEGVEGMAESARVLVVEDLWDYLKHPLLVLADPFSLVDEGPWLVGMVREQHEDVLLVVDVPRPVDIGQQRHYELL